MAVPVGIRKGITMKIGQASIHRESNLPGKAVCGIALMDHIRPARPDDWNRRCRKCFVGPDSIMRVLFN